MPDPLADRILSFLAAPDYRPVRLRRLARLMDIGEEEYGEFREAVDALRRVGRVVEGGGAALLLPRGAHRVIGRFRANPRGFGFVIPDDPDAHSDVFIPPGKALDAVTGDTVECEIERRPGRGDLRAGRIIRVIERGHSRFVGELRHEHGRWFVAPDGQQLHVPIFVADAHAKSARAGDQVVVEILTYPGAGKEARGVIVERLGKRGAVGVDLLSIIRQHHLPTEFSAAALADARHAVTGFDLDAELARRVDLRRETIITIDPDDARDFDDAISIRALRPAADSHARRGQPRDDAPAWELGVHIADVSAFVRAGSHLDTEARERGNSVYFPRHVIPMLPEVLSNGLCSLQEGEPRLCKSAFIQYSADGQVRAARFAETVIHSARRLTYRQAQAAIDGKTGGLPAPVVELLGHMNTLARIIQRRRIAAGQINLDLPEIELVLDDEQRVVDARPTDGSFTHTIIEMFMVEANEAVARMIANRQIPFLRRVHPEPESDSGENLSRFLKVAGHDLPRRPTRADLQRLLAKLKGRADAYAVNLAVLKSMEQAVYSPRAEGHYALASDCYTHFTSPIRRYTDLTVHRIFEAVVRDAAAAPRGGRKSGEARRRLAESGDDIAALGRHLSFTERRAADAERELRTVKVLELLSRHVGEEFRGVITGVTNFGVFIQHPRFLIEGLVRLDLMPDDHWLVDTAAGRVLGQRTRQRYAIGDTVTVQIVSVDVGGRELELRLLSRGKAPRPGEAPPAPPRPPRAADKRPSSHAKKPAARRARQTRQKQRWRRR